MIEFVTYCHIKLARSDGKSPHMDRSPCGDLTGAYVISPTAEQIAEIKREALEGDGFPLCVRCEAEYSPAAASGDGEGE